MDDFEYDYFMVRVRRLPDSTAQTSSSGDGGARDAGGTRDLRQVGVSGVAERLDTGEKHSFGNGAELLDVMLGGHAGPKLPRDSAHRNAITDAAPGR